MLSGSVRPVLFFILAACITLGYSKSSPELPGFDQKMSRRASPGERKAVPEGQSGSVVLYDQPPSGSGGFFQSSRMDPDGSVYDQSIWDNFTLPSDQQVTEISWRGGYDPARFGSGGPVLEFKVAIHASIPGGTEPDVVNPPLVDYQTGGSAGETPAGTFGDAQMYGYQFSLPAPFQADAGTKYWVQIVALQQGLPDWGMAVGTGGTGGHFRKTHGVGDIFDLLPGDTAFTLFGPAAPIAGLSASNDSPTVLGQVTTFTAAVSAGNGVSYTWNFGDGAAASGQVVTHAYATAGSYTAEVTASNPLGSLTATTAVTVISPPTPPESHLYFPEVLNNFPSH